MTAPIPDTADVLTTGGTVPIQIRNTDKMRERVRLHMQAWAEGTDAVGTLEAFTPDGRAVRIDNAHVIGYVLPASFLACDT